MLDESRSGAIQGEESTVIKTVLVFKKSLLPISETFIQFQTAALKSFQPQFVGLMRSAHTLSMPENTIFGLDYRLFPNAIQKKLYSFVGALPEIHRADFFRKVSAVAPKLIHAHFASDGVAALPLAKRLRVPLIVTLHGADVTMKDSAQGRSYILRRKLLWEKASLFLCVSNFILSKALEAGFPQNKLRVHYIGIDTKAFSPNSSAQRSKVILFVGRLIEKKGCEYLLRAMVEVQKRDAEARLVVIGDGPLRVSLEELSTKLGIRCNFLGSRPSNEIREWLDKSQVFCLPSTTAANGDSEGLPIVILEAQAMGVPVVATYHAGIPEAVSDGSTGLLARERDVNALSRHLLHFLKDNEFQDECSAKAIKRMTQHFELSSQTRALEAIYEEAIAIR